MALRRLFVMPLLLSVSCQTYDFEPVEPLTLTQTIKVVQKTAKKLKPNVMLVVDNSGSMDLPIDESDSRCTPGCGNSSTCPPACPTRVRDMQRAMATFLASWGTVARFGLTVFPQGADECGAPFMPSQPLPAATATDEGTQGTLAAASARISNELSTLTPKGGTPTGAAVRFAGTITGFNDLADGRDDLVLLLTDGKPNCNAQNPANICSCHSQACVDQCRCTLTGGMCGGRCATGCLDQDATVAEIKHLHDANVRTLVIGFGADTGRGDAAPVLDAMGLAGGIPPRCSTDTECGAGGSCDLSRSTCSRKYYQASNQADLALILEAFGKIIDPKPCEVLLEDRPSDERYLAVLVEGRDVPRGPDTWSYDKDVGAVIFADTGTYCAQMKASTPLSPVNIEVRVVQKL